MKTDIFIIALCVSAIVAAAGFPKVSADAFGSAAFPAAVASLAIILCLADIFFEIKKRKKTPSKREKREVRAELLLMAAALAYALLMPVIGFVVSTGLAMAAVLKISGYDNFLRAFAFGLGFALCLYAVFALLMDIYMPCGLLN